MQCGAKKLQGLPATPEAKEKLPSLRGSTALMTLGSQTGGLQDCETINVCGIKPPSLWQA